MSYSNKMFNVNGTGDKALLSALQLASGDALICGYTISNDDGLHIYFSKSLLPKSAIVNENPRSLTDEFKVITTYLDELKNSINFFDYDNIDEKMTKNKEVEYVLGWRVHVELQENDSMQWWNHSVIVRPSYVTQ